MDDSYSLHKQREREQERWLARRPVCSFCGQPIQEDDLFDIKGDLYHVNCAVESFQKNTEDYIA